MDTLAVGARALLAVVFLVAGLAKLMDRTGLASASVALGVPPRWAAAVSGGLPVIECVLAAGLLVGATAAWASGGALMMLSFFVTITASNLAKGRAPECRCFGQIHSTRMGTSALIRNLLLAIAALVLVVQGVASPGPDLLAPSELNGAELAALLVGAGAAGLVLLHG